MKSEVEFLKNTKVEWSLKIYIYSYNLKICDDKIFVIYWYSTKVEIFLIQK